MILFISIHCITVWIKQILRVIKKADLMKANKRDFSDYLQNYLTMV